MDPCCETALLVSQQAWELHVVREHGIEKLQALLAAKENQPAVEEDAGVKEAAAGVKTAGDKDASKEVVASGKGAAAAGVKSAGDKDASKEEEEEEEEEASDKGATGDSRLLVGGSKDKEEAEKVMLRVKGAAGVLGAKAAAGDKRVGPSGKKKTRMTRPETVEEVKRRKEEHDAYVARLFERFIEAEEEAEEEAKNKKKKGKVTADEDHDEDDDDDGDEDDDEQDDDDGGCADARAGSETPSDDGGARGGYWFEKESPIR